jgi:hypothetical protein
MEHNHFGDINLDFLNWPVAVVSTVSLPWLWLGHLWEYMPTMTAVYTTITIAFMLFQMADKMGWLDRFKRKQPVPLVNPVAEPNEMEQ